MKKLEKAVQILADEWQRTIIEDDLQADSWSWLLRNSGLDAEDMKEENYDILKGTKAEMTDNYEIEEVDCFVPYSKIVKALIKELKERGIFTK